MEDKVLLHHPFHDDSCHHAHDAFYDDGDDDHHAFGGFYDDGHHEEIANEEVNNDEKGGQT